MNKDLHDIDKFFKSIDDHLEEVPPGVWNEIDHSLDKKQAISFRHKYQQLKRYAIMVLLVGLLGGAYALWHHTNEPVNQDSTAVNAGKKTKEAKPAEQPATKLTLQQKPISVQAGSDGNTSDPGQPSKDKDPVNQSVATTKEQRMTGNEKNIALSASEVAQQQNRRKEKNSSITLNLTAKNKADMAIAHNAGHTPDQQHKFVEKRVEKMIVEKTPAPLIAEKQEAVHSRSLTLSLTSVSMKAHSNENAIQGILKNNLLDQLSAQLYQPPLLKTAAQPRMTITAFIAPELNFDRLEDDHHMPPGQGPGRDQFRRDEQKGGASSKGLLISYKLNDRWRLGTGFISSVSTASIAPTVLYAKPDVNGRLRYEFNCSSGNSYIESKVTAQPSANDSVRLQGTTTRMQFASIPLTLQYAVPLGKFSFLPAAGLSASFITKGNVSATVQKAGAEESTVNNLTDLRPVSFNALLQAGFSYRISSLVSVNITPGARFGITSVTKNTSVKSYPNFLSLSGGLSFSF